MSVLGTAASELPVTDHVPALCSMRTNKVDLIETALDSVERPCGIGCSGTALVTRTSGQTGYSQH